MVISHSRLHLVRGFAFLGCWFAGYTCDAVPNIWRGGVSTNWSEGGNWSQNASPAPGESVIVPSGTAFAPTLTRATGPLDSFHLAAGQTLTVMGWDSVVEAGTIGITGTVTHAANNVAVTNNLGGWTPLHRIWLKGSNITVAATGVINADYLGYPPGAGPGAGVGSGGAGHAGEGRRGFGGSASAPAYGDPAEPWQPGSGGGPAGNSRPGGGSIRIEASERLDLAGELRARGQNATGTHGRGASGGSIWLTCKTLSGATTALITVDGGDGNYYGAPGSAGRIALHYDTTAQAALPEPRPPIRFAGKGGLRTGNMAAESLPAAMATLYLSDPLLVTGALANKRFQHVRLVVPGLTHWSPTALTIDDCILGLPEGLTLAVAADLILTNGAELHLFAAPVVNVLDNAGAEVSVGGNLGIAGKSWIHPYANNTNGATVRITVAGDVTVAADSGIDADYLGYTFGKGPGTAPSYYGGAGYGGQGGQGWDGAWGGTPYGSPTGPAQAGSGGKTSTLAGQGGGAIRLAVGGHAAIAGTLTAAGARGIANHGPGGSGGGIELTCHTLTGNGLLRAEGGQGNYYGGSGSGGRIAVHYNPAAQAALAQQPTLHFSAYAPPDTTVYAFNYKAEMGSLYLPDTRLLASSPSAAALLDNQRFWHTRLMIPDWTSWSPAALTISNCVIAFNEGFHLAVTGDLTLGAGAGLNLFAAPTTALYGAQLDVGGNLMIGSGGWLYPHAHGAAGSIIGLFVGGDIRVDGGGGINADGKGWFSLAGNKQGPGAGIGNDYGGGGYGGIGGGAYGGPTYGLAALPLMPGSPGAHRYRGGTGGSSVAGKGGGAIHLIGGGNAHVDGLLSADGYSGQYYIASGGSGGAIFLTLGGRLNGSGIFRARALNDYNDYASGGGGRIAVWTHTPPTEVAWRIAETDISGLVRSATIPTFSGACDVSAAVPQASSKAGAHGTTGFYAHDTTPFTTNGVVDEPLGARYSLGMTLWHLGHQATEINAFHDYVRRQGETPESLLPADALLPPANLQSVLVEPEGLDEAHLNGWLSVSDSITSSNGDQGPTVTIPLRIAKPGLYRFWVCYAAQTTGLGVTSIRLYRAGAEHLGPLVQPDEFYDQRPPTNGPAWHDLLVELPAGDLLVKLGHVTRWWHGTGSYIRRQVDCLYVTEQIWAEPPTVAERQAWRAAAAAEGIQWNLSLPLPVAEQTTWRWWQLRPVAWEEAERQPELFALSRQFWQEKIETLAACEYEEAAKPDYRAPERQVVFNEDWNLVANPVRARRQIQALSADVNLDPAPAYTLWHDVASALDGLRPDGTFDPDGPYANHGSWTANPGELFAGYGTPKGTVTTRMQVPQAGTYHLWVRSSSVNLSYTAPWFGRVSVDGQEVFVYHHEGKISNIWMRMGTVTLPQAGEVSVAFVLDGAGSGGTYRRVHTLLLTDDLAQVPSGTIRPPWTRAQYDARAREAGAIPGANLLAWVCRDPYVPLSQEVWADATTPGRSWPEEPVPATGAVATLFLPREACRAVKIGLRNLTDTPQTVAVGIAPLQKGAASFPTAIDWRVVAFVPDGTEKQQSTSRENWQPVFLLHRSAITIPPLNVAGLWITVNTHGVPAGTYDSRIVLREAIGREHVIPLQIRVSPVSPKPVQPVLIDGFTLPHEGEVYLQDFLDHGMNVWKGLMSKAEMQRRGIRLLRLGYSSTNGIPEWYANIQSLGLSREDYFVAIKDEPGGTTAEALKPYIDVARAVHEQAPAARVSFNPGEGAELATFELLAPYCDFWIPYTKHVFAVYWGNPEKWEIFHPKPWMWYTTPCLSDKKARDSRMKIRSMPSQRGHCVGVAFFALNYPWRDQWDAGYEHISDASTMGAVQSRQGPVATIVWEQIREVSQEAQLAMMVRETLGVQTFDEVTDPEMQRLIGEGSTEELLAWLEQARRAANQPSVFLIR